MVARRHERELTEIRALTDELRTSTRAVLERVREARRELDASEPLLAFVHIPKTAGGTVISMFAAAYTKFEIRDAGNYPKNPEYTVGKVSRPKKRAGRVTVGHVPYGVYREHLPPNTRYVTFLREPVDRVLSHYYRHIHRPNPPRAGRTKAAASLKARAHSLEEALVERRLPEVNNLATRFLCGHPSPLGELPASALEDAKANLREFAFVGIQERFDESLVLLQRLLGLGSVPYVDRHVSANRPAVDEIPDRDRALIEEHNRLDAALYEFGVGLLDEAVAAAGPGFAADVQAVHTRSAEAREREWREAALTPV
jgi:hypothetical protein